MGIKILDPTLDHVRYELVEDGWWGCHECGARVWSRRIHDVWHEHMEER